MDLERKDGEGKHHYYTQRGQSAMHEPPYCRAAKHSETYGIEPEEKGLAIVAVNERPAVQTEKKSEQGNDLEGPHEISLHVEHGCEVPRNGDKRDALCKAAHGIGRQQTVYGALILHCAKVGPPPVAVCTLANACLHNTMPLFPRKYSPEATREKIRQWCDRAERAHSDVRSRLTQWGVPSAEREELIAELIRDNLLNEERYASAFASDHARLRGWGVNKILHALRAKGVSDANIQRALSTLPEEYAAAAMRDALRRKESGLRGLPVWQKKQKGIRYLLARGFPADAAVRLAEEYFGKG